jgi:hypothetical protein
MGYSHFLPESLRCKRLHLGSVPAHRRPSVPCRDVKPITTQLCPTGPAPPGGGLFFPGPRAVDRATNVSLFAAKLRGGVSGRPPPANSSAGAGVFAGPARRGPGQKTLPPAPEFFPDRLAEASARKLFRDRRSFLPARLAEASARKLFRDRRSFLPARLAEGLARKLFRRRRSFCRTGPPRTWPENSSAAAGVFSGPAGRGLGHKTLPRSPEFFPDRLAEASATKLFRDRRSFRRTGSPMTWPENSSSGDGAFTSLLLPASPVSL